jgi:xanthine dehydrogenase accessory factor
MLFAEQLVVVRGGGDLATGAAIALHRAGFPIIILELPAPLAVRRTVSFATAVIESSMSVDGVPARLATNPDESVLLAQRGEVAVMVSERLANFEPQAAVVVDARMAKRNLGTDRDDARLVVALGPGFTAGVDCDVVIETKRGHRLGRGLWSGAAEPDSGVPGSIRGVTVDRVVRAPGSGIVDWSAAIGDVVTKGERLGTVGGRDVLAGTDGIVRGLISPGHDATLGLKIGDIDPRADRTACFEPSDKARLVGAGVLESILMWLNLGST